MLILHKKGNPHFIVFLSVILIPISIMGPLLILDKLGIERFTEETKFLIFVCIFIPLISIEAFYMVLNANYINTKKEAENLEKELKIWNVRIDVFDIAFIAKIPNLLGGNPFYLIRYQDNYLNFVKFLELDNNPGPNDIKWRKKFKWPKIPTIFPLRCPEITKWNGHSIKRCKGKAVVYDEELNNIDPSGWVKGTAVMYSVFSINRLKLLSLLNESNFLELTNILSSFELESIGI